MSALHIVVQSQGTAPSTQHTVGHSKDYAVLESVFDCHMWWYSVCGGERTFVCHTRAMSHSGSA